MTFLNIFILYIVCGVVIGYPMATWSLKVWKRPNCYPILQNFLFPVSALYGRVGNGFIFEIDPEEGDLVPLFINWELHDALQPDELRIGKKNDSAIAGYMLMSSIFWPFRALWAVTMGSITCLLQTLHWAATKIAKYARCISVN